MRIQEAKDFSPAALRKHIPAQNLNRMVQGTPTSKSLQLVTDIIIDYNKLDLFLFPPPPIEDADLTLKDIDFKHEIKYIYNELVDMPEKAANDDILAHTLEKHLGQELAYLKSLYEKYALMARKIYNVELREKGEDVIEKTLTKKQKRKRREEMLKNMERLGESYEERLALSLKVFLLGHKEPFLGEEDGDSSDDDDERKKRKRKGRKRRSAKRRKENLVNHPYPRLGKVKAGAEVAPSLQNQKDEENTAPSHHENEAKVKEIKGLRVKNYSSSTKKLGVVTLIWRNKSYCRLEVEMMLLRS